jgi:hypothetical protein
VSTEETKCARCPNPPKKGCKHCEGCLKYYRDFRQKQRDEGKCTNCGTPHEDTTSKCANCLMQKQLRLTDRPPGMCAWCTNDALPGKAGCEKCRKRDKARLDERYEKGLCSCGREPRLPGRRIGSVCDYNAQRRHAKRSEQARKTRRCRNHRHRHVAPNSSYLCTECVASARKTRKKLQRDRKLKGICTRCTEKAVNGVLCPAHAKKNRLRVSRARSARIAKGICLRCTAEATEGLLCETHAELIRNAQKGIK